MDFYSLKLFEDWKTKGLVFRRVPGGWLVWFDSVNLSPITFVPYSTEFKEKKQSEVSFQELEELYKLYPRKKGKSLGLKRAQSKIRSQKSLSLIFQALSNFKQHLKDEHIQDQFIPHFSTWMNEWEDWIDSTHGQVKKRSITEILNDT